MIRTVKKMKAEGKSLEPNFKGGAKRIGRESVLERFSSLQASDSNHHIDSNHVNSLIYFPVGQQSIHVHEGHRQEAGSVSWVPGKDLERG